MWVGICDMSRVFVRTELMSNCKLFTELNSSEI